MKAGIVGLETSERETIIDFYNRGASKMKISSVLDVPLKRIKNIIRCWKTTGTVHDGRRKNGRPSKLTKEQREQVRAHLVRTGGMISGKTLSEVMELGVSERTLRRLKKRFMESDEELIKVRSGAKSLSQLVCKERERGFRAVSRHGSSSSRGGQKKAAVALEIACLASPEQQEQDVCDYLNDSDNLDAQDTEFENDCIASPPSEEDEEEQYLEVDFAGNTAFSACEQ